MSACIFLLLAPLRTDLLCFAFEPREPFFPRREIRSLLRWVVVWVPEPRGKKRGNKEEASLVRSKFQHARPCSTGVNVLSAFFQLSLLGLGWDLAK